LCGVINPQDFDGLFANTVNSHIGQCGKENFPGVGFHCRAFHGGATISVIGSCRTASGKEKASHMARLSHCYYYPLVTTLKTAADSENRAQERGPVGPTVILRKWLHYG
jgi:hypothetical protein